MLVLLSLVVSQWAFSQSESKSGNWKFGITANPAFPSWFKVESDDKEKITNAENDGINIGFSYGLLSEYQFASNYSLEIQINHLLYQGNYELEWDGEHIDEKNLDRRELLRKRSWNLQYIEIPFSLRMKTNEIGYWTYFGKFGFAPSVNIKSRAENTKGVGINEDNVESDVETDASLLDASIIVGGGAMYSLGGSTYLNGGLTFHNSLVDIQTEDTYNVKKAYVSLDLGILF